MPTTRLTAIFDYPATMQSDQAKAMAAAKDQEVILRERS